LKLCIHSAWARKSHVSTGRGDTFVDAHAALLPQALGDHVNNFAASRADTPSISLTAGCVVPDGRGGATTYGAWQTAICFATAQGLYKGYIFECWVLVVPRPVPELPGIAEKVRDLNAATPFAPWHHEGEIVAKLVVPPRQIRRA